MTPLLLPGLLLGLACHSASPGDDSAAGTPGQATLVLSALSPDEAAARVGLSQDGTVQCGALSFTASAGSTMVYLAGLPSGQTTSCTATSPGDDPASATVTLPTATSPGLSLFDNAHGEQSGNADWVIDDNSPDPSPADPSGPDAWKGAYSSFGYALLGLGYSLRTNTGTLSAETLAGVQVLVLPEPNQSLSAAELGAVSDFVQGGGGLVLITDHHGSDRDGDGVDSTDVADALLQAMGARVQQASESLDVSQEDNTTGTTALAGDPVLRGRSGAVNQFDLYNASAFTVSGLPDSRVVLYRQGHAGDASQGARVAAAWVGAGRVLCVSDSAPADDGTGASGETLYQSWTEADDAALFTNGVDWAAGVR